MKVDVTTTPVKVSAARNKTARVFSTSEEDGVVRVSTTSGGVANGMFLYEGESYQFQSREVYLGTDAGTAVVYVEDVL